MAKEFKQSEINDEKDACEIIELALNDLDALTRAFELISEICSDQKSSEPQDFVLEGEWREELLM